MKNVIWFVQKDIETQRQKKKRESCGEKKKIWKIKAKKKNGEKKNSF